MEDVKEVYLELPWKVVDECNGFGLDFGKHFDFSHFNL